MPQTKRTPAGEALSGLILDLFRLNSLLFTSGDRMVAGLGLTSARWQILGAIVAAERPQPVAWLARDLGAARQNVQRIVNDLARDGLVTFETNPHHRRAQLVVLTDKGRQAFDAAMRLQLPWVNRLADGLSVKDIETVARVVTTLRGRLESGEDPDPRAWRAARSICRDSARSHFVQPRRPPSRGLLFCAMTRRFASYDGTDSALRGLIVCARSRSCCSVLPSLRRLPSPR